MESMINQFDPIETTDRLIMGWHYVKSGSSKQAGLLKDTSYLLGYVKELLEQDKIQLITDPEFDYIFLKSNLEQCQSALATLSQNDKAHLNNLVPVIQASLLNLSMPFWKEKVVLFRDHKSEKKSFKWKTI